MVSNLSKAHKTEAHAKAQKASRAGNVADSRHFLRLAKPLGIRLFDKNVDNGQILFGIVVDFAFYGP